MSATLRLLADQVSLRRTIPSLAAEVCIDRNDASGAWVYPIPPDASEKTIDWDRFLGDTPKRPYDPIRFSRWRCFRVYGEGSPGDLHVHMLTGVHFITGTNAPPMRADRLLRDLLACHASNC